MKPWLRCAIVLKISQNTLSSWRKTTPRCLSSRQRWWSSTRLKAAKFKLSYRRVRRCCKCKFIHPQWTKILSTICLILPNWKTESSVCSPNHLAWCRPSRPLSTLSMIWLHNGASSFRPWLTTKTTSGCFNPSWATTEDTSRFCWTS